MSLDIEVMYESDGTTPRTDDRGQVLKSYTWNATHPGHVDGDGCGLMFTGPIATGTVTLSSGNSYDVTPEAIEYLPGDAGPIVHYIEIQAEDAGAVQQLVTYDAEGNGTSVNAPFKHVCTEACGAEARPAVADTPQA